ncbi:hypothetical protein GCM10028817_00740 [Spirosoma pomorum]
MAGKVVKNPEQSKGFTSTTVFTLRGAYGRDQVNDSIPERAGDHAISRNKGQQLQANCGQHTPVNPVTWLKRSFLQLPESGHSDNWYLLSECIQR